MRISSVRTVKFGSFSNDDGKEEKDVEKAIVLISKTTRARTAHLLVDFFAVPTRPPREISLRDVFLEHVNTMSNFSVTSRPFVQFPRIQLQGKFTYR